MNAQTPTKPMRLKVINPKSRITRDAMDDVGAVFVGKGTEFENRHMPADGKASAHATNQFRQFAWAAPHAAFRTRVRKELRGKHLACTCPLDQRCHAEVLIEIANGTE